MSYLKQRAFHEWKVKELAFRDFARKENAKRYNRQKGFIINPYSFGGAAATDPDFASVISLVQFYGGANGDDGSPYADVIANRSPGWSNLAFPTIYSTGVTKYGSSSLDNGSSGISNPDHADWDFGSGAFTVEIWLYLVSLVSPMGNGTYFIYKSTGYSPFSLLQIGGTAYFQASTSGSAYEYSVSGGTLSTGVWYHVAICRSGTSAYGFLSGTQIGSTGTLTGAIFSNSTDVVMGNYDPAGSLTYSMNGHFDSQRATKGVARYTSNFTPPAAAFPTS